YQNFNIFYQSVNRNLFGLGVAIMILASFEAGWFQRISNVLFGNRILYPFAQLSYSMYLIHVVPVAIVVAQAKVMVEKDPSMTHMDAVFFVFLVSTILTTILSAFMYLFIERPLMNLRK
ncbi:MAG: hypothetical protein MI867_19545, partial [Pseudomonadales bacterium]|nr:hypothetical protein [Pseudomonadales bacterium]